jgi:hypothetical protein
MVHVSGTLKTHLANSRFSPVVEPGGEHGWWCVILGRREMLAHNEGFDGRVSATLWLGHRNTREKESKLRIEQRHVAAAENFGDECASGP